ncbi:DUF885 domain-containing protein [Novosphingobium album (ex Liu et al. 2023)]|uniref:DUF885 domain-containing protein n=1 Tax=Novosphingobium album (ex Liu et al. 2023) TaxID=3031130 RepID=A0ABT5WWA4_9SPHN|nr:DUF885 domain-containing protein [Novosphingobium album (ex Liu et al. 2023)]MDE8654134.1 DUF885 domain-containing protein [Novosphingobium album (ex Liu et al. 2023)]
MELIRRARRLAGAAIGAMALLIAWPGAADAGRMAPLPPAAAEATDATVRLTRLFAEDAAREDELDPLGMLYRGEAPDPAIFTRLYTDTLDRERLASARRALAAIEAIDRAGLDEEERRSREVFAYDKREEIAALQPEVRALTGVRPFNHFAGLPIEFPGLIARDGPLAYAGEDDYRAALTLLVAFPQVLDNATLRFREGMASGVVEPRLTVAAMIDQLDTLLAQPVTASPFATPLAHFPAAMPPETRRELRSAWFSALRETVFPAYARLRAFLHDEYLPAAREEVGLSAMQGGAGLYRELIAQETTLKLEPEAIHQLGLVEVARIRGEMDGVRREMGFAGTLPRFFDHLRDDPRFHPTSRAQLADGFARIARQVDTRIPRYFAKVPRTPLRIAPNPGYQERYEPGGSYSQGSIETGRPGLFHFNTYDLPSRFLTGMTTLYLHEGAPGHHFQISLAQENTALPPFQRDGGNNAFVEGWALYAETLGYPMGLYRDPMQHWGTLDDEMLRAMRLVVDTGIHAMGWSREQAVDYMLANSGMGRTDAAGEVDRYIAMPAQALSYKIGALTIQRLRREAEEKLGAKFDIRAFHDQVLGSGALPLPILEEKIDAWIARQVSP